MGVDPGKIIVDNYKVEVVRLADFMNEHSDMQFDLLKIDVEGHELQCLQGVFDGNKQIPIRYIQIESHNDDMYLNNDQDKIAQLLNENGFEEAARIKHAFGDFYEIIFENKNLK
ncbi:FkbM family methyltransferase [Flavobacterium sp. 3HN19-14]|uniref:FkbM family methyltransferase n=1 Tax=Flavobacterium sp. 3HN19-14 TaxID=3448133 RepID=UPI003EE05BA0